MADRMVHSQLSHGADPNRSETTDLLNYLLRFLAMQR
jgi:hypothetical protein